MKRKENSFNQCGKRSNCELISEGMFEVHGKYLDVFILYVFFEERRSVVFFNISYSKGIIKYIDFVCIDANYVTRIYCLIGTADWFALVNVFDVSC